MPLDGMRCWDIDDNGLTLPERRIAELEAALAKWRDEAKDGDMTLSVPRWELVALIGEKPATR